MPLTGKDVWEAIVKAGLLSGPKLLNSIFNCNPICGVLSLVIDRPKIANGW